MHYNKKSLNFTITFLNVVFVSVYSIANKTESFLDAINAKFKVLVYPPSDIYDRSLFHTQVSDAHRSNLLVITFLRP